MAHGDITHIDIPVSDLAAAKEFYSTLFGWQIAEPPGFEGYPMWQAPNQISGGGLAPRDDGFTQPRSYVEVDSIDDDASRRRSGPAARSRWRSSRSARRAGGRSIVDPDGNEIGLYEGTTDVAEG